MNGQIKKMATLFVLFLYLFPGTMAAHEMESSNDSSQIGKRNIFKAVAFTSAYYVSSIYTLNHTWYKDKERVPFHFYNDTKGYLQVDKFGHLFGSYVYSYIGYNGLLKLGATRKEALIFGSTLGFVLQFPIEIMDGIHEGYGFSWGDVGANSMGSALVLGQALLFRDQVVKYKFSYWESSVSKNSNENNGANTVQRLLNDYNGHTYWFSLPVNKIVCKKRLPSWFNIAFGYGANGMIGEFENVSTYKGVPLSESDRYRQYLLSLDLDWTRIPTNSRILRFLLKGMTFVKLPFPALEYNSRGKFKGYWVYY